MKKDRCPKPDEFYKHPVQNAFLPSSSCSRYIRTNYLEYLEGYLASQAASYFMSLDTT